MNRKPEKKDSRPSQVKKNEEKKMKQQKKTYTKTKEN